MAAQKAESNLYYRVPEEAFDRLQLVRDSLKLLMNYLPWMILMSAW